MSIQKSLVDTTDQETSDEPERQIIFTANGSKEASRKVYRTGSLVGMESLNNRPPKNIPIEFVDWPFSKLGNYDDLGELFDAHAKVVRGERPRLAVAPDLDDRVSVDQGLEWAQELQQYADVVIVTPKRVLPAEIPEQYRVGMPCQERYGPTPWKWTQYDSCEEVHLLGGSPVKHHEILKYRVSVESVDTSVPLVAAQWGSYWDGTGWANSDTENNFYYNCLKRSYHNMRYSMNERRDVWNPRCRNRREDYIEDFRENHPDADLIAAGEEPPVHGRVAFR